MIGAQERIIGIDWTSPGYPTLYGDLVNLPIISNSDWYNPNFELLYELNPDLFIVLAGPMEGFDDMVSKLSPEIPVVAISYDTPE